MSEEFKRSNLPAPDRIFMQVTGIFMIFGFVLLVVSHAMLYRVMHSSEVADELTRASTAEATAARKAVSTLEKMSILPPGVYRDNARTTFAWDLENFIALRELRLDAGRDTNPRHTQLEPLYERAEELGASVVDQTGWDNENILKLKTLLTDHMLPVLDLISIEHRAQAMRVEQMSRWLVGGSLAVIALNCIGFAFLIVRPARRRINGWVAETTEVEKENQFKLLHDSLTGMPNAAYLHAYLTRLVDASERGNMESAVIRVSFDRFNVLRETLGIRVANEVMRIAARRVQQSLRAGDFAAHPGHDSFIVVTTDLEDAGAVATIAGRLQAILMKPYSIGGAPRRISCSMGVTLFSDDQPDADQILSNAAIALADARSEGAGLIRYFNAKQREEVERRETLYAELTHALDNDEIVAFFQPQIDLVTHELCGFEALVRWHHPKHGLLGPAAFLDFAEQVDLTERLGEVVLSRSMEAIRAWDMAGLHVPKVGVNFALAQLRNPRLIEKIKWEVERFDLDPSRLAIEVLETVLIKSDQDMVVRNLRGLASAGFGIELDDFGTGHASISNLRRFMVNRIKIDRSFVFGIETSEEQQQLTASMVAMARALGIEVLAEGVETDDALAMLRRLGCNFCQGYLIAKPMSQADTFDWLKAHGTRRKSPERDERA
ncbi:putative bifunctional diguanylate cyclase/phosphodiesterase [Amaricoccus tamworthensis]|uniref:putative bifunctional diguanylate cyclase/phosphodiesterase n=1 Tax=Amaricoccus tamworthensis TaxID=57002 RepID=UPI003C7CC009